MRVPFPFTAFRSVALSAALAAACLACGLSAGTATPAAESLPTNTVLSAHAAARELAEDGAALNEEVLLFKPDAKGLYAVARYEYFDALGLSRSGSVVFNDKRGGEDLYLPADIHHIFPDRQIYKISGIDHLDASAIRSESAKILATRAGLPQGNDAGLVMFEDRAAARAAAVVLAQTGDDIRGYRLLNYSFEGSAGRHGESVAVVRAENATDRAGAIHSLFPARQNLNFDPLEVLPLHLSDTDSVMVTYTFKDKPTAKTRSQDSTLQPGGLVTADHHWGMLSRGLDVDFAKQAAVEDAAINHPGATDVQVVRVGLLANWECRDTCSDLSSD